MQVMNIAQIYPHFFLEFRFGFLQFHTPHQSYLSTLNLLSLVYSRNLILVLRRDYLYLQQSSFYTETGLEEWLPYP